MVARVYEEIPSRSHEELEMQVIKAPLDKCIRRGGIVDVWFHRSRGQSRFAESRSNCYPVFANGCEPLVQRPEDVGRLW